MVENGVEGGEGCACGRRAVRQLLSRVLRFVVVCMYICIYSDLISEDRNEKSKIENSRLECVYALLVVANPTTDRRAGPDDTDGVVLRKLFSNRSHRFPIAGSFCAGKGRRDERMGVGR